MCPAWLLVAVALVGVARGDVSECWEHPRCQDVNSETSLMECIRLCRSDLTSEMPVIPGAAHLQPPPPPPPPSSDSESLLPLSLLLSSSSSSSFPSSPQAKRSYSMEHFRWGKPVGRKRRPVKVYAADGVEEESAELFPEEMRRRELAANMIAAAAGEEEEEAAEEEQRQRQEEEKKDGAYKMKHFRWSGPAAGKRYGGFMKSWDVINKDGQQGEQ